MRVEGFRVVVLRLDRRTRSFDRRSARGPLEKDGSCAVAFAQDDERRFMGTRYCEAGRFGAVCSSSASSLA
jgi:hypothetical protein